MHIVQLTISLVKQDYVLWNAVSAPLPHVTLCYCYSEEEASKTFAPFVLFVIASDKNVIPTVGSVFVCLDA